MKNEKYVFDHTKKMLIHTFLIKETRKDVIRNKVFGKMKSTNIHKLANSMNINYGNLVDQIFNLKAKMRKR